MFIKIDISSHEFKNEIILNGNNFYVNGVQKNLDVGNFASKLFCIISSWESNMIGVRTTNDYKYQIDIKNNGEEAKIIGINKFPPNYNDFIKLLSEAGVWKV